MRNEYRSGFGEGNVCHHQRLTYSVGKGGEILGSFFVALGLSICTADYCRTAKHHLSKKKNVYLLYCGFVVSVRLDASDSKNYAEGFHLGKAATGKDMDRTFQN